MAGNKRFLEGKKITVPVAAGEVSGNPIAVGQITGVALIDRTPAGNVTLDREGVYSLNVSATAAPVTVGMPIYWAANANPDLRLSEVAAGGILFGYSLAAIAQGQAAVVDVVLK